MTEPQRERTIGGHRVFDGKLLHLRVDEVVLPDGRRSVREVIEHPGSVAILPVATDGRLILIRQWRHAVQRELLEIPAGTLEPGETVEAAAHRELREETGYSAGSLEEIADLFPTAGYSDERMTLFFATGCTFEGEPASDGEWTCVEAIEPDRIAQLVTPGSGSLCDAKSLIAVYWWLWRRSEADPAGR